MTGTNVRALREGLGWTGAQFASLFGVHASTIYRWEEQDGELKAEPLQLQLLTVLRDELRRGTAAQRTGLRESLESALALGGSLRALHTLLARVYSDDGTGRPTVQAAGGR